MSFLRNSAYSWPKPMPGSMTWFIDTLFDSGRFAFGFFSCINCWKNHLRCKTAFDLILLAKKWGWKTFTRSFWHSLFLWNYKHTFIIQHAGKNLLNSLPPQSHHCKAPLVSHQDPSECHHPLASPGPAGCCQNQSQTHRSHQKSCKGIMKRDRYIKLNQL